MHPPAVRRQALDLIEAGLSLNAISKELGVSRSALREWRDGVQTSMRSRCPVEDGTPADTRAYAELLGFYLGDGCISTFRGKHVLRITLDEAYPGIIANVTTLVSTVKQGGGKSFHVRATGCIQVTSNWKHWPCLFPQHGPGRKHERELNLADWQRSIMEEHPAQFLRGLLHSDGCRITNWTTRDVAGQRKRYEYGRWMFNNESRDIMRWCQEALDWWGVAWTMPRTNCLSVATRAGVAFLDEVVGPKS